MHEVVLYSFPVLKKKKWGRGEEERKGEGERERERERERENKPNKERDRSHWIGQIGPALLGSSNHPALVYEC
jgi:hypothetical protein